MERNVPKLRFKGFNDEWKIDKLNENTYIKGRIGWKNLKQEEYTLKGPYLIAGKHINEGIINWDKCDHISEERYEESMEIALKDDDIIFSKDGSIGNPALIQNLKVKATINGTMMLIRLDQNEYEPSYFYQILKSEYFEKLIRNVKSGSSIPHIFQRDMIEFKFPVPGTLQEQKRIANFLTKVDKIIEKQDEKVKNLEKYKKGMMQKIFSQEIRFKDENGEEYPEWEIKRVEDVANIQVGFTPDTKNDSFWDGDIKWLSIAGMNSKYIFDGNKRISNEALGKRELIPKNTLVMSFKLTIGRLAIIKEPMITNEAICQFYWKNKNIINEYMYQYLDSIRIESFGCRAAKGITLNNESLNSIIVKLPCLDEQNKIADLLNNIDCIHQEELNKLNELKQWKKGLLQQMFV